MARCENKNLDDRTLPRQKSLSLPKKYHLSRCEQITHSSELPGVSPWHPNQLRHSFATRARAAMGLEAAQVALGHSQANVTQIYAERDARLAVELAKEIG